MEVKSSGNTEFCFIASQVVSCRDDFTIVILVYDLAWQMKLHVQKMCIRVVHVWVFLLLVSATGCGTGSPLVSKTLLPVSGSMTVDNKPVPYAFIEFVPADAVKGVAGAVVLEEGRFRLSQEKGLAAGEYDVLVIGYAPETSEGLSEAKLKELVKARLMIPEFYQQRGALKVLIAEGESTDLVLKLSSKPPKG